MKTWQMYWPNWWKLWPSYQKYKDTDYEGILIYYNFFCLGPIQIKWWSQ